MKTQRANASLLTLLALPFLTNQLVGADYPDAVLSDAPEAYYRLNDNTSRSPINVNSGSLGAAGNATNDLSDFGVVHPFSGAIVGDGNRSEFFDFNTRTEIPFNAALNPPNTQPFTVEGWFYPASDQTATGMGALANRWTQGGPRQGWVMYQRKPNADYFGSEPVGWEFRMYNGVGGNSPMDVTSLVPYEVGKWQHIVVVYDPVDTFNASVTIYIDGVAANTNNYSGVDPGYAPCTGDHPPGEAVNGQPAMALGNYNNANSGTFGAANPWYGAIDEYAWYGTKLTPAQILAHYQNGTNANRTTSYSTLIQSHNPAVYLRLDEIAPGPDVAVNMGDLRSAGVATHKAEVVHPGESALAGRTDDGSASYHNDPGSASTTSMPWRLENNPPASVPFTFETWIRPMKDQQGGQSPVNNRWQGGTGRTGWVIFQRNPNLTYPASEGHGWNFRMYSGNGSGGQDVLTDTDYTVGEWQHLVFTWEPEIDNGDPAGNGNNQWQGKLTAYVDGVAVAQNPAALYAANTEVTETGSPAADLGIGSYNFASSPPFGNPFEGNIDELAFYNNYVLTPEQIMAHYQAGTNANYGTNYETLVLTAGFTGPEREGLPKTYLHFNDPAYYPAANSGTLGYLANASQVTTTNVLAGPRPPAYAGFEVSNLAEPLDGVTQWANLNNPTGLNFSGLVSLEAWIKPDAAQADPARIISHGPQTPSNFLTQGLDNAVTNTSEVFLAIEAGNYVVGSREVIDGVPSTLNGASFAVPPGDLGGPDWIHLIGTYDGANWKLYRNGIEVASAASAIGALIVTNGDWAIGSTGNGWANNFAGAIDEVAIYDPPLNNCRAWAHFFMGKHGRNGLGGLKITRTGGVTTVTWPAGRLQQADNVTGPWSDLACAIGGPTTYNPPAGPAKKFYRVKF